MAGSAKEIFKANSFSDVITVLKRKVEEINPVVEKVNIVIFAWMGYFLLFENMFDIILYANTIHKTNG